MQYKYNYKSTNMYMKVRGANLFKIKVVYNFKKDFLMNIDKFLISISLSDFISSMILGVFNLYQ